MALTPGATNGPVDMSVTVTLLSVEMGVLAVRLPVVDCTASIRSRLLSAEAQCEAQATPQTQMTLSPLEQGLLMGALGECSCQFSLGLRGRLQNSITQKLAALGAQVDS